MANSFKIGNVIPRLFNGSKYETDVSRISNKIASTGTSNPFRVNVLTADVFETTALSGTETKSSTISKIKRMASTFVGSIGDAFPTFRKGIESIASFCGRVKNGISGFWNFLNETKIPSITDAGRAIKARWDEVNYTKEVNMYASKPVSEIKDMFINELSLSTAA